MEVSKGVKGEVRINEVEEGEVGKWNEGEELNISREVRMRILERMGK